MLTASQFYQLAKRVAQAKRETPFQRSSVFPATPEELAAELPLSEEDRKAIVALPVAPDHTAGYTVFQDTVIALLF